MKFYPATHHPETPRVSRGEGPALPPSRVRHAADLCRHDHAENLLLADAWVEQGCSRPNRKAFSYQSAFPLRNGCRLFNNSLIVAAARPSRSEVSVWHEKSSISTENIQHFTIRILHFTIYFLQFRILFIHTEPIGLLCSSCVGERPLNDKHYPQFGAEADKTITRSWWPVGV